VDTLAAPKEPIKILLEMRPALEKHAGIPQQTRLLFRGLSLLDEISIEGLIQSGSHALGRGLSPSGRGWLGPLPKHKEIDRLARVVIMLEQSFRRSHLSVPALALRRLLGGSESLTRFESRHYRDFIWRRLFSKTLPATDFERVTAANFRIARAPWTAMHVHGLISRYMGRAVFPRLDTSAFDVMISETPYPAVVSKSTRLVVRYHDAIPMLMPHTISKRRYHQAFHYRALRCNVDNGAWFACVSEATRKDLLAIFPQAAPRAVTIHNIISHDYFAEASSSLRVREIVRTRLNPRIAQAHLDPTLKARLFEENTLGAAPQYLLMVSTIEPRKNHLALLSAWERLRAERFPQLKLLVVGSLGWQHRPIVQKLVPWLERGEAFVLEDVPSPELRLLYKHAAATVCPSFAEGFDLSGVEAMKSGGAVAASDIPVHREIYANAAEYFNPYSVDDLSRAIQNVVDPACQGRREELVQLGAQVAGRYGYEAILPKWQAFLGSYSRVVSQ
jgi:glycosyltransferase involved in cell wall biosynthesis